MPNSLAMKQPNETPPPVNESLIFSDIRGRIRRAGLQTGLKNSRGLIIELMSIGYTPTRIVGRLAPSPEDFRDAQVAILTICFEVIMSYHLDALKGSKP